MTLPTSGAISFNAINTELLVPASTTASLGQASYRTLAGVASGAISMSNFYGKSNRRTTSYVFSSPVSNQSLNISTLSGYIAGLSCVTITVNPGVYVYSTSVSTAALSITGGTSGDNVRLVNNGYIMGQGGTGADGGFRTDVPYNGPYPGGPAISLSYPVTIDNTNCAAYIGGGGGGGAYGYQYYCATSDSPDGYSSYGGGGGAGGGSTNPAWIQYARICCCNVIYQYLRFAGGVGGDIGQVGGTPCGRYTGSSYGTFNGGGGGRIFPGVGGIGGGSVISPGARRAYGSGGGAGGGGSAADNVDTQISGGTHTGEGGSANNPGTNAKAYNYRGGYIMCVPSGGGGGGGGWGASGGVAYAGHGAGGKAVALNGKSVTWVSGNTTRVWGGVS
jgi:hypothetical protein